MMGFASLCQRKQSTGKELSCAGEGGPAPPVTVSGGAVSRFSSPWASTGTGYLVPVCAINLKLHTGKSKPADQQSSKGSRFGSWTLFKPMLLFPQADPCGLHPVRAGRSRGHELHQMSSSQDKPGSFLCLGHQTSPILAIVGSSLHISAQSWEEKEHWKHPSRVRFLVDNQP